MENDSKYRNFRNVLGLKMSDSKRMNKKEMEINSELKELEKEIGSIKQYTVLNCSSKSLVIRNLVKTMFENDNRPEVKEVLDEFMLDPKFSATYDKDKNLVYDVNIKHDMEIVDVKRECDKILASEFSYIDRLKSYADMSQKDQLDIMLGMDKEGNKDINQRNPKEMLEYYFKDSISSGEISRDEIEGFVSWKDIQIESEKGQERYGKLVMHKDVLQDKLTREKYKKSNPLKYYANEIKCTVEDMKKKPKVASLNPASVDLKASYMTKNNNYKEQDKSQKSLGDELRGYVANDKEAQESLEKRSGIERNNRDEISNDEKAI